MHFSFSNNAAILFLDIKDIQTGVQTDASILIFTVACSLQLNSGSSVYQQLNAQTMAQYPKCGTVATSLEVDNHSNIHYNTMIFKDVMLKKYSRHKSINI